MAYLNPCFGCERKGSCEKQDQVKALLKGTPVTSAKIRCLIPASDFPPGVRVKVKEISYQAGRRSLIGFCYGMEGTALRYDTAKRKVAVLLDEEPWACEDSTGEYEGNPLCRYQRFHHKEIERIDQDAQTLCRCGWPMADEKCAPPEIRGKTASCNYVPPGEPPLNKPGYEEVGNEF